MAVSFASLPTFDFVNSCRFRIGRIPSSSSKKPLEVRCCSGNIRETKQCETFGSPKLMTAAEIFVWGIRRVEEDMVDGFSYEVPEEYQNMPLLMGRASVDMKVKIKDIPNLEECIFRIVLDGYNAPVAAGNFVGLVERHFYDGMEIQRSDGFVVQTGDPEDPSTEKTRTVPLEIMVTGKKAPFYGSTLEVNLLIFFFLITYLLKLITSIEDFYNFIEFDSND